MMPSLIKRTMYGSSPHSGSWTDDLPVCKDSGIGFSTNAIYRDDGQRQQEHEFEDCSFHFKYKDNTCFYGVFDGHDGAKVAKYASDTIAGVLLELDGKTGDEDIKLMLKQAFASVESNYLESVGDKLAERTSLQLEIPEELNSYEAYQKYPVLIDKLNSLNAELSCGTTAVTAMVHAGRLYVANVGDSRALLCRTDPDGVLRVVQLSQDHVLSNEDEMLRLSNLGISVDSMRKGFRLGNQECTRCLGNYLVKGAYKDFEELRCASSEPVIAEPEITGGIPLDGSCRFLMLMSSGLYRSLEEAIGTQIVNQEIAQMVAKQFRIQSTITSVAQAVVDEIVRVHHDVYMSRSCERIAVSKRDDITLLIRNFNYVFPNAISPSNPSTTSFLSVSNGDYQQTDTLDDVTNSDPDRSEPKYNGMHGTGPIKPYVDFSQYFQLVEEARREGRLPEGIDFD